MVQPTPIARFAALGLAVPCLAIAACSSTPTSGTSTTGGGGSTASVAASTSANASTGSGGSGPGSTSSTGQGGHGGQTGQGGGSGDPCATALLCDDFEAYAPGGDPGGKWVTSKNNGALSVDTTRFYSGAKSVKITAAAASGYRSIMLGLKDKSLLPVAGNVVYGRMMFWLESAPTTSVHWTFIDGSGKVPGQAYDSIYRYGGQLPITTNGTFTGSQLMANYDTPDSYSSPPVGPASDCWLHSNKKVVPVGAWTCAEWSFDGPKNEMHFWMNGAELTDLAMTGTGQGCVNQPKTFKWDAPSFEQIDVGWESYQADDARTMWIDDVAIGTQRLGCPAP